MPGAFSLGNSTNTFNLTLNWNSDRLIPGPEQFFQHGDAGIDVVFGLGGGGAHAGDRRRGKLDVQ